ncbi:MAG: hypothetical protein ACXU9K_10825, partial [Thermodesulfobacteriota bacterium]
MFINAMIDKTLTQFSGGHLVIDGETPAFAHRRTCLSILRTRFGVVFEHSLKRTSKTLAISTAFFATAMLLAITHWALAQEGSFSDVVKDLSENQGIQDVTIGRRDASTSATAGTAATDEAGNYSLRIAFLENYTLLSSKPRYDSISALDLIEIFNTIPNGTLSISKNLDPQLRYRPSQSKRVLSWETGEGKSYFIPALEIPGFILVLNGFDRLVFGNERE